MCVCLCSPVTPPGTKVKVVGTVAVHNGFLLLKKTSLEVLGGKVDALLKKWNSQRVRSHLHQLASTISTHINMEPLAIFLQMTTDNLDRTKVGAGTGPPLFTPFTTSVPSGSKTDADKSTTAEAHSNQVKKPSGSGYLPKGTELSKKQQPYYKSSKLSSRDPPRPERGKTGDKGRGKGEEKMKSEQTGKTNSKQGESWRRDGNIHSNRSSKESQNQAIGGWSKEKDGEREVKYQTKSRTDSKDGTGVGDGSSREFIEPRRGGYSHRDRGRRGRGRSTDLDNRQTSSLGDSEPHRTKEPFYEGGRRGRGRGRGRGKGRRGRKDGDDDGDYKPSSRPTTGLSLGDYFDQKLVLSNRDSSHFGWYEEDYLYDEWEPCDGMEEYRASYPDQREARHTHNDKTRTKEAWAEEEYPPMPSAKFPSASGRPSSPPQEQPTGESHWDWVTMSGSGAPSTAKKL